MILRGSEPVLLKNPIFFCYFPGDSDPCTPSGSAHVFFNYQRTFFAGIHDALCWNSVVFGGPLQRKIPNMGWCFGAWYVNNSITWCRGWGDMSRDM